MAHRETRRRQGTSLRDDPALNLVTAEDQEKATGPIKPSGRVLVVTRLGRGGTCHVGYVDGRSKDANEHARKLADEHARTFKCGKDKAEYAD